MLPVNSFTLACRAISFLFSISLFTSSSWFLCFLSLAMFALPGPRHVGEHARMARESVVAGLPGYKGRHVGQQHVLNEELARRH